MQSNTQIYLYVLKLTGVIAIVLSLLFNSLNPMFLKNKETAKKKAILSCIPGQDMSADVQSVFDQKVKISILDANGNILFAQEKPAAESETEIKTALDKLNERGQGVKYSKLADIDLASEEKFAAENRVYPIYQYEGDEGKNYFVLAVRGNGLWDKIWGYVALEYADKWQVAGVNFDHKGETPGLGAEIKDNADFKAQFENKQIFNEEGKYVSVQVLKKNIKHPEYQVKAISGATVTCDGVSEMMQRGIGNYLPYIKGLQSADNKAIGQR